VLGQGVHAQVGVEVVGDPRLELAQRAALRELRREVGAELRLAAGALEEEDQPASDLDGGLASEVLLHQGEGKVHSGSDAGRGPDVPVPDEDRVGVDRELRVAAGELCGRGPVGRDGAALEQAGAREQERSRADRGDAPRAPGGTANPADQGRVVLRLGDPEATGDDQRVDRAAAASGGRLGDDPVTARTPRDRLGFPGDDLDRVRVATGQRVGPCEYLGRPDHVERLHAGESEDDDAARLGRGHEEIMVPSASVRNAQWQTIPAIGGFMPVAHCADLDWSARSGVVYLDSTPGFGPGRGGSTPPPGIGSSVAFFSDSERKATIPSVSLIRTGPDDRMTSTAPTWRRDGQGIRVPG
jgi:hypothetical protein